MNSDRKFWKRNSKRLFSKSHPLPLSAKLKLWMQHMAGKYPILRGPIRFLRKAKHLYNYSTNHFHRSYCRWINHNPNDESRFQYDLPSGANILDVGGYAGDFALQFIERFNAKVTVFEAIRTFALQIERRFANDPRVRVYNAGLSDRDETVYFSINADASGQFGSSDGQKEQVALWDAERFLKDDKIEEWHLAKINIEGGEYALLNRLIDTGRIQKFKYLQIQFHLNVPNAKKLYKVLKKRLRKTHRLQWRYTFVWESWERRDDVRG